MLGRQFKVVTRAELDLILVPNARVSLPVAVLSCMLSLLLQWHSRSHLHLRQTAWLSSQKKLPDAGRSVTSGLLLCLNSDLCPLQAETLCSFTEFPQYDLSFLVLLPCPCPSGAFFYRVSPEAQADLSLPSLSPLMASAIALTSRITKGPLFCVRNYSK